MASIGRDPAAAAGAGTATATSSAELVKSRTPTVYVPRRFRLGRLQDIRTGAAIVGTPQGDGMVAVDFVSTRYVEPTPETWSTWVAEAARRHSAEIDDLLPGEEPATRVVPDYQLLEVGRCIQGHVLIEDPALGIQLQRWIEAGRVDHMIDGFGSTD